MLVSIASATAAVMPTAPIAAMRAAAESIYAHAIDYHVPLEVCLRWIHSPGFDPRPAAWIRECEAYARQSTKAE